jgi:hypothetical protein
MKNLNSLFGKLRHGFSYGDRIRPARDWFVLLTITGIILCISIAWNIWLLSRVTSGEAIGTATSTPPAASFNVDSVQTMFEARAAERGRYVSTYHFVDPSL